MKLELSDPNTAFFSVTDTGCGIPLEKQGLIFERFEKLNDFAQGSGLGLSICQLIVTYMRGRIWVDSNYTQGARFCFTHPLKYKSKGRMLYDEIYRSNMVLFAEYAIFLCAVCRRCQCTAISG